jgi:WD40 repeat protein
VTIDEFGRLRVWDRETGSVRADTAGSGQEFSGFHEELAVFTPDGGDIVAIRNDADGAQNLVVLDAATLAPVGGEPVPTGNTVRMLGVTPDGKAAIVVVSGAPDPAGTKVLRVDLETRRILRSTPVIWPDGQPFTGARNNTVAADGRTVGIGNGNGDVVIVDAVTGTVSPILHAHSVRVESITFAPDYSTFVTTAQDGEVKLWDMASKHLLGYFRPAGDHRVRALFLEADRVLLVDNTGEIREWDPRSNAWEAYACRVAGRNLTKAEWAELFAGQAYRMTCPDFPAGE